MDKSEATRRIMSLSETDIRALTGYKDIELMVKLIQTLTRRIDRTNISNCLTTADVWARVYKKSDGPSIDMLNIQDLYDGRYIIQIPMEMYLTYHPSKRDYDICTVRLRKEYSVPDCSVITSNLGLLCVTKRGLQGKYYSKIEDILKDIRQQLDKYDEANPLGYIIDTPMALITGKM